MTDRERWTVYPLLLLSLGVSLRSHVTQTLDLREISCHTLRCNQIAGKEPETACQTLICEHIAAVDVNSQRVAAQGAEIVGSDGKPRMLLSADGEKKTGGGLLLVLSPKGDRDVLIGASPGGGVIEIVAPVDAKRKLVRIVGAGGDRVQQVRVAPAPADEPSKKPSGGTDEKPGAEKPATPDQPAKPTDQPGSDKPQADQPEAGKPEPGAPETDKPGVEKPEVDKPADEKPAVEEPTSDED